jgi:gluconolactonase
VDLDVILSSRCRQASETGKLADMTSRIVLAGLLACVAAAAAAQSPSSGHPRGSGLQAWQNPGLPAVLAKCKTPPPLNSERLKQVAAANADPANAGAPPEWAPVPASTAIPGVIAAGQNWKTVWSWEGNNTDGPIAGDNGTLLFANNDASNVMKLDPTTGLATVLYGNANTAGALSRSKNGALFVAERGLGMGIEQLEPQRKMLANSYNGEPFECVGGGINDLAADARGGVYISGLAGGVYYANPQGVVSRYGEGVRGNGIILSPDEKTLYVTNGGTLVAFDVKPDGSLTNQRDFGKLRGGQGGDGSAVDAQGRVYVATGRSVDVFTPGGEFLGSIMGPQGLHGTAFGGPDKKTLYAIVFYGTWGTKSARNRVIAIPTLAQGYAGRAK